MLSSQHIFAHTVQPQLMTSYSNDNSPSSIVQLSSQLSHTNISSIPTDNSIISNLHPRASLHLPYINTVKRSDSAAYEEYLETYSPLSANSYTAEEDAYLDFPYSNKNYSYIEENYSSSNSLSNAEETQKSIAWLEKSKEDYKKKQEFLSNQIERLKSQANGEEAQKLAAFDHSTLYHSINTVDFEAINENAAIQAEINNLITFISPNKRTEVRRMQLLTYIKAIIRKSLGAQVYPIGSFALKTYLNNENNGVLDANNAQNSYSSAPADDPMQLSAFFSRAHDYSWLQRIFNALLQEQQSTLAANSSLQSEENQYNAMLQYSISRVVVNLPQNGQSSQRGISIGVEIGGTSIEITGNNVNALCNVALFERMDMLVRKNHLFKRSVLLVTNWAKRQQILNENQGLLGHSALRTLLLFIFNAFHADLHTPLHALCKLLHYFAGFDWDEHALTVFGPVDLTNFEQNNQLTAVKSGKTAWPAGRKPLISREIVKQYLNQSNKQLAAINEAISSGNKLRKVNSGASIDTMPSDSSSTVSPSSSFNDLAALGERNIVKSLSSSSMTGLNTASTQNLASLSLDFAGNSNTNTTNSLNSSVNNTQRNKSYSSLAQLLLQNGSFHSCNSEIPADLFDSHLTPSDSSQDLSKLINTQPGESSAESPPNVDNSDGSSEDLLAVFNVHLASLKHKSYSRCSLNILDAIDITKNLGSSIEYRNEFKIRRCLQEGLQNLYNSIQSTLNKENLGLGLNELSRNPLLNQLFDAGLLEEYREKLYRENKQKVTVSTASTVNSSQNNSSGSNVSVLIPTSQALSNSTPPSRNSSLLPVPSSALSATSSVADLSSIFGAGKPKIQSTPLQASLSMFPNNHDINIWSSNTAATLTTQNSQSTNSTASFRSSAFTLNSSFGHGAAATTHSSNSAVSPVLQPAVLTKSSAVNSSLSPNSNLFIPSSHYLSPTISATNLHAPPANNNSPFSLGQNSNSGLNISAPHSRAISGANFGVNLNGNNGLQHGFGSHSSLNDGYVLDNNQYNNSNNSPIQVNNGFSSLHSASSPALLSLLNHTNTTGSSSKLATTIGSSLSNHSNSNPNISAIIGSEYDSLDGNFDKIVANLTHAKEFNSPDLSEGELVQLIEDILIERGSVPVGRLGSLLHDATNNHSLPAMLKEQFGGLKRLLERHPEVFLVGKTHPYNPEVRLTYPPNSNSALFNSQQKKKVQRRRTRTRRLPVQTIHAAAIITNNGQIIPTNSQYSSQYTSHQHQQQLYSSQQNQSSSQGFRSSSGSSNTMSYNSNASQSNNLTYVLSIDCEMVGKGPGGLIDQLARVTIINYDGLIVYDKYVLPLEPITDYRSSVSGCRPEHFLHATEFSQVQREVVNIIKNRIIVGHGLQSDFQSLCIYHPKKLIRDTATYAKLCPGKPLSLKRLAAERLGVEIQLAEHSPVEDARAALLLYKTQEKEWENWLNSQPSLDNEKSNSSIYNIR
jgi:RNA exonuclease 4